MQAKQTIKAVDTPWYEVNALGWPRKHVREYLEFETNREAFDFRENNPGYWLSGWTKGGKFRIARDYNAEPTFENKARIRLEYCRTNKVHAICACCGKELHEHQIHNHTLTKYGYIGPECIKRVSLIVSDIL